MRSKFENTTDEKLKERIELLTSLIRRNINTAHNKKGLSYLKAELEKRQKQSK